MTYDPVCKAADTAGLLVMGALHPAVCGARELKGGTLILLGAGPAFWPQHCASAEATDGQADPIDRWSTRVVDDLAARFGASALFPFGGPPYAPFIDWALKSGRAFVSPVGMMVHDKAGLMISYRGALHFPDEIDLPPPDTASPCLTCAARPCTNACPVLALQADAAYDLAKCHAFLDTRAGADCLANGCAVRVACPISAGAGRTPAQSAQHMKAFHPG